MQAICRVTCAMIKHRQYMTQSISHMSSGTRVLVQVLHVGQSTLCLYNSNAQSLLLQLACAYDMAKQVSAHVQLW